MEVVDRRVKRGKRFPKVPIKTYKWEDVQRSRRRGGYPWTHLYKEPFYDHLDPEPWTMEGMRKAKSSSTMGKSDDFSISEVSTFDNRSTVDEILDNPSLDNKDQNHSIKTSCSSLNLEEQELEEIERTYEIIDKEEDENQSPGMFFLHSEESSDDISQYLDKEERVPETRKESEDHLQREDDSLTRKRKLSAESSISKLSLGKKAILQKLKDAKEKIKVPKVAFSTKLKKPVLKKLKNSPPEIKKLTKKPANGNSKDTKPVYIHIPLKPPPGETDEFSHLKNNSSKEETAKKPGSFKDLVKNFKYLQEPIIEHKYPSPIRELSEEKTEQNPHDKELVEDTLKRLTSDDQSIREEKQIVKETKGDNSENPVEAVEIVELTEDSDKASDTENQSEAKTPESLPPDNDVFDKLFEASSIKSKTDFQNKSRQARSKSAEPERKRKLSLESSYSRKSLSKLGFLKKLRDAKDKVKNTFSRTTSKKDIEAKEEPIKPVEKSKIQLKSQKHVEPVYIHIPLKPPEGQTDQYSHLENESKTIEKGDTETMSSTPESPEPTKGDVQLIILTAPSDDEILDYNSSDVPETPVSENKIFFPLKVHELKEIAKVAVDEGANKPTLIKLTPVDEEPVSPQSSNEDIPEKLLEKENSEEKMMIDEEDGLNESKKQEHVTEEVKVGAQEEMVEAKEDIKKENTSEDPQAIGHQSEEKNLSIEESVNIITEEDQTTPDDKPDLKSVLRSPNSPIMKKKVSFKRKSKKKNDELEEQTSSSEVEIRNPEKKLDIMAIDKQVKVENVKNTTAKENEEIWSKISDHDDEPEHLRPTTNIEIPTFTLNNTPAVVISTEQALGIPEEENYGFSTKHVYEEIAEGSQKKSFKTQKVEISANTDSRSSETSEKPKEGPNKFKTAFKRKADNFKSKIQNLKRPNINLPERPKFQKPNLQRFKIEKPKWNIPKIPDTAKINLPHFSLHRRQGGKKPPKRISSTESTSGDSKKPMFDFGTYPRIFKRKSKPDVSSDFATIPRTKITDSSKSTEDSRDSRKSATDSIRISLHKEDSDDKEEITMLADSTELNQSSHIRYEKGIDSEDEYDKERRELMEERDFLSRWQKGSFNPNDLAQFQRQPKVTDLDSPYEDKDISYSNGKDQRYSSGSSVGIHRQGVIEEINPDEFFLRQKGISQDNIEVGLYLSTEIREAFRNPTNALVQMEENNFDRGSHHSLPDMQNKRKPIKKPKRKKTPHASQEKIPYGEEETADEEFDIPLPSRPKRRSKKKKKTNEGFIPYQETIQVDEGEDRLLQHRESLGILADDEREFMYENEKIMAIDPPEIKLTNPYKDYGEEEEELEQEEYDDEEGNDYIPQAPPRMKPKNIKSLRILEAGFATQNFDNVSTVSSYKRIPERISYHTRETETKKDLIPENFSHEFNITEPEISESMIQTNFELNMDDFNNYRYMDESFENIPPAAPPRKQKSVKSLTISENNSISGDLTANQALFSSEKNLKEPQIEAIRIESKIIIPIEQEIQPVSPTSSKFRAKSKSKSNSRAGSESRATSQDNLSLSLHADSLAAENSLPCAEEPCIQTVCDYMGYTTVDRNKPRDPPLPPPRTLQRKKRSKGDNNIFSTVPRSKAQEKDVPLRPLRIYSTIGPGQKSDMENKENVEIDIMQYIEQDDSRNLQSGEIIEKIKARPLPTPPRPPRKTRPMSDITSRENIMTDSMQDLKKTFSGEIEVYTQTEPLPDDFVCEEVVQEPTDRIIIPTQSVEKPRVKRELITPTLFTHEETITHGSLIVEPLNGAKLLPDSEFTKIPKEIIIPVQVESENEETSSIPEEFHKLSYPKEQNQPSPNLNSGEVDVLKAHRLQVTDLDVDTLTVNKLLAEKVVVSEIDSKSILTNEISSKSGALKIGEINVPPEVLEQIIRSIQSSQSFGEMEKPKEDLDEQKKTPIEPSPIVEFKISEENNVDILQFPLEERLNELITNNERKISDLIEPEIFPVEVFEETPNETIVLASEGFLLPLEVQGSPPSDVSTRIFNENVELSVVEESSQDNEPPHRPPRQSERLKPCQSTTEISVQEPEVDDEAPPRPPQPLLEYIPSQPPSSFYALRAQKYVDENIPVVPRRRRHTKSKQLSRSSSEGSSGLSPMVRRHHRRSSEPSICHLSSQLVRACGSEANIALKRLITYILNNVLHNEDGKQDLNVMIIIVLVLIAGLLLLGYGEERTVVHLHHWEYFNPPKNL